MRLPRTRAPQLPAQAERPHRRPDRHLARAAADGGPPGPRSFRPPAQLGRAARLVAAARARQAARYAGLGFAPQLGGARSGAGERWPLPSEGQDVLDNAMAEGGLTRRGMTRVHRVALSVADLAGRDAPMIEDVETALALRPDAEPARHGRHGAGLVSAEAERLARVRLSHAVEPGDAEGGRQRRRPWVRSGTIEELLGRRRRPELVARLPSVDPPGCCPWPIGRASGSSRPPTTSGPASSTTSPTVSASRGSAACRSACGCAGR